MIVKPLKYGFIILFLKMVKNGLLFFMAIGVFFLLVAFVTKNGQKDNFENAKEMIVMRNIAHQILRYAGDSTSRIMPVHQIAENEFLIREYKHIHIVTCDAYEYVKTCSQQFDLIIVDIFVIDTIPEVFTQEAFLHQLAALVLEQGQLIYNTMRSTMTDEGFLTIQKSLSAANMQVNTLEKVAWTNDLILAKKNKSSS